MSRRSWRTSLIQAFKPNKASDSVPRVAVVGVGHELCGDDAAGLVVAHALQTALAGDERLLVIEAGSVPENQTGRLRRFKPGIVLLIDAAQMGDPVAAMGRNGRHQRFDAYFALSHPRPVPDQRTGL
jgi:hypothetical protein